MPCRIVRNTLIVFHSLLRVTSANYQTPWVSSDGKLRSAAGGPVVVKLRFELQKPRESGQGFILVSQEADIEVHPSEGLEIFKFQVRNPCTCTPHPPKTRPAHAVSGY